MSGLLTFLRVCLLALVTLSPQLVMAAEGDDAQQTDAPPKVNAAVELPKMQKVLDKIKQQVSGETNDSKLMALNELALELSGDADTLMQGIVPQRAQLQAQLAVLGPAPQANSGVKETAEVTSKRNKLENQKGKMDAQIKQAEAIKSGAINLSAQIVTLRRDALKTQLALNAGSILGPRFWAPLYNTQSDDSVKISDFIDELTSTAALSWESGWRFGTIMWVLAAGLVAT
ncbi:MAG TPA: DUF3772 domain-containing protein, partial [Erwinia persicina]|nr:DUF3772 domain-containing protein [Erwinia persicina]